jgi:hypothetical protein
MPSADPAIPASSTAGLSPTTTKVFGELLVAHLPALAAAHDAAAVACGRQGRRGRGQRCGCCGHGGAGEKASRRSLRDWSAGYVRRRGRRRPLRPQRRRCAGGGAPSRRRGSGRPARCRRCLRGAWRSSRQRTAARGGRWRPSWRVRGRSAGAAGGPGCGGAAARNRLNRPPRRPSEQLNSRGVFVLITTGILA